MLGNKKVVLEIGNQYLLKKEAKALDKKKKKLVSQIVRIEKRVKFLAGLLDKGEPSFYFSQVMFWIRMVWVVCLGGSAMITYFLKPSDLKIEYVVVPLIGFACFFVDEADFHDSLPFFLTRSSVATEIVSERKELYIVKTELKKVEMKRKTIVVDSEGKLRYESYVLITQDRCYLEEIAKGCLKQ
jgi:hypothetical protein